MAEHTTAKLARALGEIAGVPDEFIERAADGYYHDFLSPLTFPEIQLVTDLRELASRPSTPRNSRPLLRAMVRRVIAGDFDATKEESADWARSAEGQAAYAQLDSDVEFRGMAEQMGLPRCQQCGRMAGVPSAPCPACPDAEA